MRLAHLKQALRNDILAEIIQLAEQPATRAQLIESAHHAEQAISLRARIQRESREVPLSGLGNRARPAAVTRRKSARHLDVPLDYVSISRCYRDACKGPNPSAASYQYRYPYRTYTTTRPVHPYRS